MTAVRRRRFPVDLIALIAIAVVIVVTHRNFVRRGLCFDDPSWFFHFGKKTLDGAVPYRDYVFQVGPLPIYVDAAFQSVFGSMYRASLYASLAIKILRVFVVWALVRRVADVRAATLVAVFCGLFPVFAVQHHWSAAYAQLFITLAGLCFLLASRTDGRRALVYLALAGASCALIVTSRQSSAIMCAAMLLGCTVVLLARREYMTAQRFAAVWGGFAAGILLVVAVLAALGALTPAVQQMFLDAAAKKGVSGVDAVLDAISGGALVDGTRVWWSGFLFWLGLPTAVVAGVLVLLSRREPIAPATVGLLMVPAAILLAQLTQFASLGYTGDLPRMLLTAVTALAVLWPARLRAWFGIEPIVAVGIAALPLASDWAFEMSNPGRGWGDATSLVTGALLLAFVSSRVTTVVKLRLAGVMAVAATAYFATFMMWRVNPFAALDAQDGTAFENRRAIDVPILDGMRVNAARKTTIQWLRSEVRSGSTCFVYANMPILYDVLECTNPTPLDTTAGDFMASHDAAAAIQILQTSPPDYIIEHEAQWMNPPLSVAVSGYVGLNPRASKAMHEGLRSIIGQYEVVGTTAGALGPELSQYASVQRDKHQALRVYRLKR